MGKLTLVQYILFILPFSVFEEKCLAETFLKLLEKVTFQQQKIMDIFNFLCLYHFVSFEVRE